MFSKILIANRGEIALRVIRACKELGIRTVAVYSEADVNSLHVKFADEAICIGASSSANSYLNIPAIISAAEITDVEAIHPGYGFLAENPHFAEICESCQIKFIGPTSESMKLLGDKLATKNAMRKVGIPSIPGSDVIIKTKDEALKIAKKLKYPIIIKATAGGGGKGMRVAHNDVRLSSAFYMAQSEAESAFGISDVYIEKYIERPRHIEFQILADEHDNVVHLGERDCTIQRRHQKLIEESPSPNLSPKLRKRIGELVVKGAKHVKYVNAGTVEFLLDKDGNFYFMEMNARIQVEHPVTEMVTGIDLIKEQLRIASGEKLGYGQDDIVLEGHAIECRINAEDPENNFMPSPGVVDSFHVPGGRGVRVDSHIYNGYMIPPYYDSLIAKIITHGRTRNEAIYIMQRALDEFLISPIKTTIPFHRRVMADDAFLRADIDTTYAEGVIVEAET
ncbi:MAG: acetyl-CoA carboxylase biotin carboxylase subunit [Candidatus Omnitrophota bacterium]